MKVFLVGYIASGKRKWAARVSTEFGMRCIDTRELMEELSGRAYSELLLDKESYIKYEQLALDRVLKEDNVVVVCSELLPCRADNMERINDAGLSIYLRAGLGCIMMKLPKKKHLIPLIKGIDSDILPDFVKMELTNRKPFYSKAHHNLLERELKRDKMLDIIKAYKNKF